MQNKKYQKSTLDKLIQESQNRLNELNSLIFIERRKSKEFWDEYISKIEIIAKMLIEKEDIENLLKDYKIL